MKENTYSLDLLGRSVTIRILDTEAGLNALIYGGDLPHIGAVSVKCPGKEVNTQEFPSHRDGMVSEKWAEALCDRYGQPAVVSCGIHYDFITREQISFILTELDKLLKKITS